MLKFITRTRLLFGAELIDAYRVVPRICLLAYGFISWEIATWFFKLEVPTTEQTAFVSTFSLTVSAVIGLYQNSGRKWRDKTTSKS